MHFKQTLLFLLVFASIPVIAQYKEGYIPIDGKNNIFYQKSGSGKQVIIIPMGFMLFEDFQKLNSPERTLIFYDMRNRGRSDFIADTNLISIQHDVEDVETLRKYFKIDKMSLIGWSYLGKMVIMYALKYPRHVNKLVQIGAVPMNFNTQFPDSVNNTRDFAAIRGDLWNELQQLQKEGYPQKNPEEYSVKFWNNFERWWLVSDSTFFKNMGKHWGNHVRLRNEQSDRLTRHLQYHFKSAKEADISSDEVKKIRNPVLTIHGRKDRNAPYGGGKQWAAELPNAIFISVNNAAHMPWIENPVLVFGSIDKFLRDKKTRGNNQNKKN